MVALALPLPAPARATGGPAAIDRWATRALVLATALAFLPYLLRRPGFVLDDWFTLRNAHFDGAFGAAGAGTQAARPGAWLVYAVVFGALGGHLLAVLALLAAVELATAVLLFRLLRRHLGPGLAVAAASLWVLLPNHTSTEVWASGANIAVAGLLTVAGLLLTGSPRGRAVRLGGLALLGGAVLCYEATLPVAAAGVVVTSVLGAKGLDRPFLGWAGLALGAPALWIVTHWSPDKHVSAQTSDLGQTLPAHFGWGVAPSGPVALLLLGAAVTGVTVVGASLARPSRRRRPGGADVAVLTGVAVIALGTLPFVRYPYAPLGAGDRVLFLSSMGGALVWAGLGAHLGPHLVRWRVGLATVVLVLLAVGGATRWSRAGLWHDAGRDAEAIVEGVRAQIPAPSGEIVVGPAPIQRGNVAAFIDRSNIEAALQLAYDRPDLVARLSYGPADFDQVPPALRFDLRPVSRLRPDTIVSPG